MTIRRARNDTDGSRWHRPSSYTASEADQEPIPMPRNPHSHLRVGIIGAGAMGALHARVVTQSQTGVLATIFDPDVEAGRGLAARYNSDWAPEPESFDGFDAVIVSSPTNTHVDWGLKVIQAGVPLMVEKPISDDLTRTQELIKAAASASIPMTCGFVERFNPAVRTALQIMEAPLHIMSVRHSPYAARIKTGVAADLLIHDIDLAIRFVGSEPLRVSSSFSYLHPTSLEGAEDIAEVKLRFKTGALAALSASRIAHRKVRSLTLGNLDHLLEIDLLRRDITIYRHVGNRQLNEDGPGYRQETIIDIPAIIDWREPLAAQFDHFISLARGDGDATAELDSLLPPHEVLAAAVSSATSDMVVPISSASLVEA